MPLIPDIDPLLYFSQSAAIPAPYFTDWRIVRVAEGVVRITLYERSYDQLKDGEPISTILQVRGAFTTSIDAFDTFLAFANKLREAWKSTPATPVATNEGTETRN
jgi:hypothetical protein